MPNVDYSGVDFIRSPTKQNRSACHQMQHLFIQGVRNLLQLLPGHVKNEEIKKIITCMLEVRLISSVYTYEFRCTLTSFPRFECSAQKMHHLRLSTPVSYTHLTLPTILRV